MTLLLSTRLSHKAVKNDSCKERIWKDSDNSFYECFIRFHPTSYVSYFYFLISLSLMFIVANKNKNKQIKRSVNLLGEGTANK